MAKAFDSCTVAVLIPPYPYFPTIPKDTKRNNSRLYTLADKAIEKPRQKLQSKYKHDHQERKEKRPDMFLEYYIGKGFS